MFIEKDPKSLQEARKKKNILRKKAYSKTGTDEDRKNFRAAVKTVSFLKKKSNKNKIQKSVTHQEKRFSNDFWRFSKDVCNGKLGQQSVKPAFTKDIADDFYPGKYSKPYTLDFEKLQWFPYIPVPDDTTPFDLSPVTPKQIKHILAAKKATSSPGPDGLLYGLLKSIPAAYHFLATLFTQLLLECPDPPQA